MSQCCIPSCERSRPELYLYSMTLSFKSNQPPMFLLSSVLTYDSDDLEIGIQSDHLLSKGSKVRLEGFEPWTFKFIHSVASGSLVQDSFEKRPPLKSRRKQQLRRQRLGWKKDWVSCQESKSRFIFSPHLLRRRWMNLIRRASNPASIKTRAFVVGPELWPCPRCLMPL